MGEPLHGVIASAHRVRIGALACVVVSAAALAYVCHRGAVVCQGGLDETGAPEGWRAFPPLVDRGGFSVASAYVGKMGYGHEADGLLYDPRLCRYSGVSVDAWLSKGYAGSARYSSQIVVASDPSSDVFVVSGPRTPWPYGATGPPQDEAELITAFRRSPSTRIGWVAPRWTAGAFMSSLALAAAALGAIVSSRRLARARALLAPSTCVVEGVLDASGTLTVDGERLQHDSKLGAGPVLVRTASVEAGDYRTPGNRRAIEVTRAHSPKQLASSARGAARAGILAALLILALGMAGAACVAFTDAFANFY